MVALKFLDKNLLIIAISRITIPPEIPLFFLFLFYNDNILILYCSLLIYK